MADHLTPAELVMIDAIVDPIRRERAAAPGLAAKYDDACDAVADQYDEIVRQRRRIEALEDQLSDAQKLADRLRLAWRSARRRARRQRDALREAMAADRDLVRRVRDRYRRERDAARREADADRARILGIVNRWVEEADNGVSDHGDLCDDLRAAGYTLPTTAEMETDR